MKNSRIKYAFIIILIILLGLTSMHVHGIPLWIGDILWAMMIFYIALWLFIHRNLMFISIVSLCYCYGIEISQLYQAPWINHIRHTLIGSLILGEKFEWGDMLCYTIGIGTGVLFEIFLTTDKYHILKSRKVPL